MKRASATLIGAFVVGGLLLVVAAIVASAGGALFTAKERVVMHFTGSIFGLQVGAPVVFRGVRLGSVESIGLLYDPRTDSYTIPVVAELEREAVRGLAQPGRTDASAAILDALVAKGLRAQLAMQSLLTGQLYVDLDLRPDKALARLDRSGRIFEIPTTPTAIQALKSQLDGLDFKRLVDDVAAIASSARTLAAGPQLKQALDDLAQITGHVRRVSERIDQRITPLTQAAEGTLAQVGQAAGRMGQAASQVGSSASQLGTAAARVGALAAPDSPLLTSVQQTADDLARTAAALRRYTADDALPVQQLERALQDVSRASRAVRELADLLEQRPEALLRGWPRRDGSEAGPDDKR
ncbi:MAG: MlaD family protein [Burkholderiales bacterium]